MKAPNSHIAIAVSYTTVSTLIKSASDKQHTEGSKNLYTCIYVCVCIRMLMLKALHTTTEISCELTAQQNRRTKKKIAKCRANEWMNEEGGVQETSYDNSTHNTAQRSTLKKRSDLERERERVRERERSAIFNQLQLNSYQTDRPTRRPCQVRVCS